MPSGYTDCACRDCFGIVVSSDEAHPELCEACRCQLDDRTEGRSMRKGDMVRVAKDTEAMGSAVVVGDRISVYLRGNGAAPAALRLLRKGLEGRVLGTRAASKYRGQIAIVQFAAGVASVLTAELEAIP